MRYEEALLRIRNLGSGLVSMGLRPGSSTFVGVYCQNSPEWVLSEHAIFTFSMVIVPLYDTLGPEACQYIINQGMGVLWCCRGGRLPDPVMVYHSRNPTGDLRLGRQMRVAAQRPAGLSQNAGPHQACLQHDHGTGQTQRHRNDQLGTRGEDWRLVAAKRIRESSSTSLPQGAARLFSLNVFLSVPLLIL